MPQGFAIEYPLHLNLAFNLVARLDFAGIREVVDLERLKPPQHLTDWMSDGLCFFGGTSFSQPLLLIRTDYHVILVC